MRSIIFVILIGYVMTSAYATDAQTSLSEQTELISANVGKIKQNAYLQEFSKTFQPYNASMENKTTEFVWYNRVVEQTPYKVSLVGVNINTWLETPQYFEALQEKAKNFPVGDLLANLKTYNPNLTFNNPNVVSEALKADLYTPYLTNIENYKSTPLLFSDISNVVSYTRRYHIYGSAAGNLPYFGRPVEGANRIINLGVLKGQLREISVKLPDTDIFLVAMVNIVPNWLEEGWDIFHISQQELEILVYAFDRKGNIIGGAGIPMEFRNENRTYRIEQKILSQFWQTGVSRQFYVWPSFKILNNRAKGAVAQQQTTQMPVDKRPTLNGNQKYILSAIEYLRSANSNLNIPLFTAKGEQAIEIKKSKKEKVNVKLTDRVLVHKDSFLNQATGTSALNISQMPLLARLSNIDATPQKNTKVKTYIPSNEGDKLISIIDSAEELLTKMVFSRTNKLFVTNKVIEYEFEKDPITYKKEQKKYAILPNNIREYHKIFEKNTKNLVKQRDIQLNDKLYWNRYRVELLRKSNMFTSSINREITNIQENGEPTIYTQSIVDAYKTWTKSYKNYVAINKRKLIKDREYEVFVKLTNLLPVLKERNEEYIMNKYFGKDKKLESQQNKINKKSTKIESKLLEKATNEVMISNLQVLQANLAQATEDEKQKYQVFLSLIPKEFSIPAVDTSTAQDIKNDKLEELANYTELDMNLIIAGIDQGKISPLMKEKSKVDRKAARQERRNTKFLSFEGFMLGLTGNWATKSRLTDRLDNL